MKRTKRTSLLVAAVAACILSLALPAKAAVPYVYRLTISGTNGVQLLRGPRDAPFTATRIVVVNALPTNSTVIVKRFNTPVSETLGTHTDVNGAITAPYTNAPPFYAGERIVVNGPGVGTVTNATVEIHGTYPDGLRIYD